MPRSPLSEEWAAEDDPTPDLIAELIGEPEEREPPSPFDTLDALLRAPANVREWGLRKLFEVDPSGALEAIFPEYHPRERFEFGTQLRRQRISRRVRDLLDESEGATSLDAMPDPVRLTDFLAEPDEEARYRVESLWPRDGRVLLAAQFKAGKSTLVANLIRCLVDGDDFLDRFVVEPADRVVLIDDELAPGMLRHWLRHQAIRKTDAVNLVSLRGRLSTFNLLNASVRAEWARMIGPADVLIIDCLRPALDALGLSEDKEAGRFLTALDELAREADVSELLLVHHMGHANERSRGDSRLLDWPDAIWKLVRDDAADDLIPSRFFSAIGRDVEQPEVRLHFDLETRQLSVDGPSRSQARAVGLEGAVQRWVHDNPGCTQNNIEQSVEGKTDAIRRAIKSLVRSERIRIETKGRAHLHYEGDGGAAAAFAENA